MSNEILAEVKEAFERALRVRIWNECKERGMKDDDAFKRINATIEAIRTEAIAALRSRASGRDTNEG